MDVDELFEILLSDDLADLIQWLEIFHDINQRISIKKSRFVWPFDFSYYPSLISLAAFLGAEECFNYLLDKNADPLQEDELGRNCLHFASMGGKLSIFIKINYFQFRDLKGNCPIHYAIMYYNENIVKYILSIDIDALKYANYSNEMPIHLSCQFFEITIFKLISSCVIDPCSLTKKNFTLLNYAVISNSLESVIHVISLYPYITCDHDIILNSIFLSIEIGNFNIYKNLTKYIELTNEEKSKILLFACKRGDYSIVKYIIQKGVNLNIAINGEYPLIEAIKSGSSIIVDLLIANKAELKISTNNGNVIEVACKSNMISLVRKLIDTKTYNENDISDNTILDCLSMQNIRVIAYLYSISNERFVVETNDIVKIISIDGESIISTFPFDWII